jgi:poly(A) polymerase
VSHERLGVELSRILVEGGAPLGIRWLIDLGLMRGLIPELVAMEGVAQPSEFHPEGDVLTHVLLMLGMMRNPSPELAFGVLLHDVGKPLTFERADRIRFNNHDRVGAEIASTACRRLRCSNDQVDHVTQLVAQHHQFMNVRQMRSSTLKRFLRLDRFEDHLELHRLDCLASHRKLGNYDFCVSALEAMGPEEIRPAPLVKGDDLIEMGYSPGPLFRRVLEEVENAQLDGQLDDRDAALALARRTFGTFLEEDGVRSSGEGINSPADS